MSTAPVSLLYVALTAMLAVAPIEPADTEGNYTLQSTSTRAFSPEGSIRISNVNGSIHIEGWNKPELRMEVTKKAKFSEDIEGATISEKISADSLSLKTSLKTSRRGFLGLRSKSSSASIDYRIWAPKTAAIKRIESVNGPIVIHDFEGMVNGSTVNGPAELKALRGNIKVSTVNGAIKVSLDAEAPNQEIELDTVNGSIGLQAPSSINATFRGKSINGEIQTDFGLEVKKQFPVGKKLSGKTGSGGTEIELNTVNGRISIEKQ